MTREYPTYPILTVSGIIKNQKNQILLILRRSPPYAGTWSLPGGAVQVGETLEEALKREIREECGIDVKIHSHFDIISRIFPDEKGKIQYHYVIINYLCLPMEGKVIAGSDAANVRWVSLNELDQIELAKGIKEVIQKFIKIMEDKK